MLHLVFHWPDKALWQRFGQNHHVVFMGTALYQLLKTEEIAENLTPKINLYVLQDDLLVCGLEGNRLPETVHIIDYPDLVQLTVVHHPICSWTA